MSQRCYLYACDVEMVTHTPGIAHGLILPILPSRERRFVKIPMLRESKLCSSKEEGIVQAKLRSKLPSRRRRKSFMLHTPENCGTDRHMD